MTDQTTETDTASASLPRPPMRIRARGRSFLALVLSPEAPLTDWVEGLDRQIAGSAGFFAGRPVILDLGLVSEATEGLEHLQTALTGRGIQVIGIEGADRAWESLAGWVWPADLQGGRASGTIALPDAEDAPQMQAEPPPQKAESLILDRAIRSGQSIVNLEGDIVVLGSVASGAELMAAGSIHVYGALRGRAIAGVGGLSEARIFATRMLAELLAIDGFYMVAEEIDETLHDRSAQAFLADGQIKVTPLR